MTEPLVGLLAGVWTDVVETCADLATSQWDAPTECPGWTVRDNVAHMLGAERALLGEKPEADEATTDAPYVRNKIGRYNERWIETYRGWDGDALLDEFKSVTARRLAALNALGPVDWDRNGFTPEGDGPYRLFMEIRLFDCWYHDQDIREALDRPGFLDGPVADAAIGRIPAKALGYVVGKKAAAPPNTTVMFEIAGTPPIVAVIETPPEGRAVLLDESPPMPTVRISTDRRTFARLAGGRWSAGDARRKGSLQVTGDAELGSRVVENLAFTL
jgi:uncharacterized protein (TIGR03083 family)